MPKFHRLLSSEEYPKKTLLFVLAGILTGLMVWGIGYATPAFAQNEAVQIEIIPNNIELIPGRQVEFQVSIRNLTDNKIQNLKLSCFTASDIKINIEAPEISYLEPQGAVTWVMHVTQTGNERINGAVHLRVDYTWQMEGSKTLIAGVAYRSVDVETQVPEAIQVTPEIQVKTAIKNLVEGQPGILYVVLTNKSDLPIRVTSIEPDGPDFIRFNLNTQQIDEIIEANNSKIFRYTVQTGPSVTPGTYLLLFKVEFSWESGHADYPGSVFETYEIDVSVFGESGIMSVLGLAAAGIPTFLILPGFLMIVTIGVLWRWITPKAGDYSFRNLIESFKMPEFWFWVFTLSFLMIPVYRFGSELLGVPRDLLSGYSFVDITAVWFGSILLAASGFILFAIIKAMVPRVRKTSIRIYTDWKMRQLIPSNHDSPIEILEKLDRQDLGVFRERAIISIQGQQLENPTYLLQPITENKEEYWVSPRIKVRWKTDRTQEEDEIFRVAKEQLSEEGNDAGILASKLLKAYQRKTIQITWEPTTPVNMNGPYLVKKSNIQLPPLRPNPMVTMEEIVS